MEFNKYKERGAYHWREYEQKTKYGLHAEKVSKWVRHEGRTLDIGAGDGLITHLINGEGIDDDETAVKLAQDKGVNVIIGDAYNLKYFDNVFDNIFMGDVIEHLEFPDDVIKGVKRILKPNGYFYVVTPPAVPTGVQDKYHYREYKPDELIDYLKEYDFNIIGEIQVIKEYKRMYGLFKNDK